MSMTDGEQRRPGILDSVRRLGDSALGALQTRIELLAVELAEEKRWLVATLIWTVAAIFFLGIALLTITATVVALCPAEARPFVLMGFSIVYVVAALVAINKAKAQTKDRDLPLSNTINELKKDIACLRSME
jgi:uncharacterized membrane protein YqjE